MRTPWASNAVALVVLAVLSSACGSDTTMDRDALSVSEQRALVFETQADRHESGSRSAGGVEVLADGLSNHLQAFDGGPAKPIAVGVVSGIVTNVEPGAAWVFSKDEESDPDGKKVPFDSPDAAWRTFTVTVEPTQAWGTALEGQGEVKFD